MKEIYQQTVEEVLERVNGKKSGLTSEQVKRSREKCGWNELTEGKKKGILQIFFEQYKDFLVLILIASAIIYHAKYKVFRESKCNYKIEVTVEIGYT